MARIPKEPATERRVYVLPNELLGRIRRYQSDNNISSEVEAVRKLLDESLQSKDTLDDIMAKISRADLTEGDLRVVAQKVLSGHVLVKYLVIDDGELRFGLRNGYAGGIDLEGNMRTGTVDQNGHIELNENWDIVMAMHFPEEKDSSK